MNGALYTLLYGAAWCAAWMALPFSRKVRRGLLARRGVGARYRRHGQCLGPGALWFHVASAGELEQCLPILDALKREAPEKRVFLSYFSPSAEKALERERARRAVAGRAEPWDRADYSPWDFPWAAAAAVKGIAPGQLVVIHRELWPGLFLAAERAGVRCSLVATHWNRDRMAPSLHRRLSRFSFIGAIRPDTARRLGEALPGVPVETLGDPRVDRVLSRRGWAKETPWKRALSAGPVFVAASLWDEDFRALKPLIEEMLKNFPHWRVILVPHEPTTARVADFAGLFTSRGVPVKPWSTWSKEPHRDGSHLVLDGVGWLAELYASVDIVFVGGSFRKRVHNVLEPAAYGRPILTGPHLSHSTEACEMAAAGIGLKRADTAQALVARALPWLKSSDARAEAAAWLARYLEERRGAGERYALRLLQP